MTFSRRSLCAFVCSLTAFAVLSNSGCNRGQRDLKNKPAVRVNDSSLSAEDFAQLLASRLKMFNDLSAKDALVIQQAKAAVVQDFIVRVVTQEWAQNNKIFLRKEQIDAEIESIRKNYPDDVAFRQALADQGISYSQWESRLKSTLLEKTVLTAVLKKQPALTTDELQKYYQANRSRYQVPAAVKLRQLVVPTDILAEKMRKEISQGKSLASLAQKYSISPEGRQSGEMNWIEKGSTETFEPAFRMNIGQRSPVIKSPYGYHIFEVLAKRSAKNLSFDEAKKSVHKDLSAEREQHLYTDWLEEQVLKAKIFKDDTLINGISVNSRSLE